MRAARWRGLLVARGCRVSLPHVSHIILVGMFANNFLPTSFGGDAYRGVAVDKACPGFSRALASVLVDRLLGLFVLLCLATAALVVGVADEVPKDTLWAVFATGGGVAALLVIFLAIGGWRSLVRLIPLAGVRDRVERFTTAVSSYGSAPGALAVAFVWSVAMQVVIIFQVYLFGLSLDLSVSVLVYALFVPVILTFLMLPVSIGGLGVREGLFVLFFATAGVPAAQALGLSLLFLVSGLILSLYGGYLLMISGAEERRWVLPKITGRKPRLDV